MSYVIGGLIGLVIGFLMGVLAGLLRETIGTLKIDQTDPEKDLYSIEIGADLDTLPSRKSVRLKVNHVVEDSQK